MQKSKVFVSRQRQQQIYKDIEIVFRLIEKSRLSQNQTHKHSNNTVSNPTQKNKQKSPSENKNSHDSKLKMLQDLKYTELIYLISRKTVLMQFIEQNLSDKYHKEKISNFPYPLSQKLQKYLGKYSPQITLLECLNHDWSYILSPEDVFYDAIQILKFNISKNWRSNQIKVENKLKSLSTITQNTQNESTFLTKPNLEKPKNSIVIQESTRNILTSLEQLKREMEECQAEMNIAKNNDDRILQKGRQFATKKRQFNKLKQQYRKRTKDKAQTGKSSKSFIQSDESNQISNNASKALNFGQNKNSKKAILGEEQNLTSKVLQKISEVVEQNKFQEKTIKINQDSQRSQKDQNSVMLSNSKEIEQNNRIKKLDDQSLTKSIVLNDKHQDQENQRPQITVEDYNELIRFLEQQKKKEIRDQRVNSLTQQKDRYNIIPKPKKTKQNLTISVQTEKYNQENNKNTYPDSYSTVNPKSNLIMSPKQYILDKYIKKVFNHYILQQSSFKSSNLFEGCPSSVQLNFSNLNQSRLNANNLKKKFSVQMNQSNIIEKETPLQRKKLSVINSIRDGSIHQVRNLHSRVKTLSNSTENSHFQRKMNIQSYSKFIRAFSLNSKSVTLHDIMNLFKQKSQNKKSISYDQFLELFEAIHRLQCQKLQIQFTPVLFDGYLKNEVFSWEKINKVLRLKTISSENKVTNETKSTSSSFSHNNATPYKFTPLGHSGMLSEAVMQKINSSKKPFERMPCMQKAKTIPTQNSVDEQLPMTKLQIKIEQMKRLKNEEKSKQLEQMQMYKKRRTITQNPSYDESLLTTFKNDNMENSYVNRFKRLEEKKRQLANLRKLNGKDPQLNKEDNQRYGEKMNGRNKSNQSMSEESSVKKISQQMENFYGKNKLTGKKNQKGQPDSYNGQGIQYETIFDNENFPKSISLGKKSKVDNKRNNQNQITELQKIIGIRQSDQDDEQDIDNEEEYRDTLVSNKKVSRLKTYQNNDETLSHSKNYGTVTSQNPNQIRKTKKNEEDEYLASYLTKNKNSSPISYVESYENFKDQIRSFNEDQSLKGNNKLKWKNFFVHF